MKPFVIAPLDSGLNTYYPAWIAPDQAWYRLQNAYPRRGKISKRVGDAPLQTSTNEDTRAPQYTVGGPYTLTRATGVITTATAHRLRNGQRIWLDQASHGFGVFTVTNATATAFTVFPLPVEYDRGNPGIGLVDGEVECYLSIQGLYVFENSQGANRGTLLAMTGRQLLRYNTVLGELENLIYVEAEAPESYNYETMVGASLDNECYVTNFRDSVYRISIPTLPEARWYAPRIEGDMFIQSCRKIVTYRGRLLFFNTVEGRQTITAVGNFTTDPINLTVNGVARTITPAGGTAAARFADVVAKLKELPEISNAIGTYVGGGNSPIHICPAHAHGDATYVSAMTGGGTTFVLAGTDLINYPYRVRFSVGGLDLNDSTSFRAELLNGSGFDDAQTGEAIVGAEVQNDLLVAFFERSTWQLQWAGNPLDPFFWTRVNNQYGSGSETGTWNYNDTLVSISQQGIIQTDGRSVERIDLPILDRTVQIESSIQLNNDARQASNFRRVHVLQDYNKQLLVWTYPGEQTSGNDDKASIVRNDNALYWNYPSNAWGEASCFWTCLSSFRTTREVIWADLTQPWEFYTQPWNALGGLDEKFLVVAGHDSGRLLEVSDVILGTTDRWGQVSPFGVDLLTKFHSPFLQDGMAVRVPYVDIYGTVNASGKLTLNVYADDNDKVPANSQALTLTFANQGGSQNTVFRVYCNAYGRNLAFQIVLDSVQQEEDEENANARTEIEGLLIYAQPAGRFYQSFGVG